MYIDDYETINGIKVKYQLKRPSTNGKTSIPNIMKDEDNNYLFALPNGECGTIDDVLRWFGRLPDKYLKAMAGPMPAKLSL